MNKPPADEHDEEGTDCWCHPEIMCAYCDVVGGHCGHPEPFIVVHQERSN